MTSVLDLLRSPSSPPRAILRLLPGDGGRGQLADFVAEAAEHGPVVVLVTSRIELDQWFARLQPLVGVPLVKLTSTDEALQLQEANSLSEPVVLLSTVLRARRGPLMSLLKGIEIELFVADGPVLSDVESSDRSVVGQTLELVATRARRTVVVLPGTTPFEWEGAVDLREVTKRDFSRAVAAVRLVQVPYEPTSDELDIRRRAQRLLEPYLPQLGEHTLTVAGTSELHHRLLMLLTRSADAGSDAVQLEGQPRLTQEETQTAWDLLDTLENSTDSKLAALDSVLHASANEGRSWLITATVIRDASYIADHLRSAGHRDVRLVTSLSESVQREADLRFEVTGQVVVGGRLVYSLLDQWPPKCDAVWWSPPRSRAEFENRMALLATGTDVTVYQLSPKGSPRGR